MTESVAKSKLEPLAIKCTHTDCENGLHCWRVTKKMAKRYQPGHCIDCGVELIDWKRVHQRDPHDVEHTFGALRREWIRHRFWHIEIDQWARNAALRLGRDAMDRAVDHKLRVRVGPEHPYRDGGQTPLERDPVAYAQHATASCCRKCIKEWHGIPEGQPLADEEILYLKGLALAYIDERFPDLPRCGQKVPPIRTAA
jgi:hypothetical protein